MDLLCVFPVSVICLCLLATVSSMQCPNGWVRYTESCYYFHTDSRVTWSDASQDCSIHGAHLADIDTLYEMLFVASQLGGLRKGRDPATYNVWIGGSDETQEGTWLWADSDELIEYTYWESGEPKPDTDPQHRDCIALIGQDHFKWRSEDCHQSWYFVCEQRDPDYDTDNGGYQIIG